jgi:hypothetical protein
MANREQDGPDHHQEQNHEEKIGSPAPNGSSGASLPASLGDGRIPPELRQWILERFPEKDVLRSLDELNEQECLELSQFLDLGELERVVASEQAQRQR